MTKHAEGLSLRKTSFTAAPDAGFDEIMRIGNVLVKRKYHCYSANQE